LVPENNDFFYRTLISLGACGDLVRLIRHDGSDKHIIFEAAKTLCSLSQLEEGVARLQETEGAIYLLAHLLSSQGPNTAVYLTTILATLSESESGQRALSNIPDLFGILTIHLWSLKEANVSNSLKILANVPTCFLGNAVLFTGDTISRLLTFLKEGVGETLVDALIVFESIAELEHGRKAIMEVPEIVPILMKLMSSSEEVSIRHSTRVLAQLASFEGGILEILKSPEILQVLPPLLEHTDADIARNAITLLHLLCTSEGYHQSVAKDRDTLQLVLQLLKSADIRTGSIASAALSTLLFGDDTNSALHGQIFSALIDILKDQLQQKVSSKGGIGPIRYSMKTLSQLNKRPGGHFGTNLLSSSFQR